MLFKKKDKESKPKKEKKVPVMKVGTHKKTVIALWVVLCYLRKRIRNQNQKRKRKCL